MSETPLTKDTIERARRYAKADLHPDHIGDSENLCGPFPCACAGCEHNRLIIALCDAAARAETLEAQLTEVTRERDDAKLALSVVQNAAKTLVRGADERVLNATKHEPAARVAIATLDSEREMNAILTQQLEAAEAALAPLRAVVEAFLAKWEQVKPAIDGAFVMGHVHGARYTGPTIGEEIEAMRRALPADPSAPASGQAR